MDITAQAGLSQPVELPNPLSAYDYARLYNEALLNDGQSPIYSQADLNAYRNNSSPYTHPNIDWYQRILDDQTPFNRYTLNAEGTGKSVRSEEHTSELQSLMRISYAVFCLKKKHTIYEQNRQH